MKKFFLQFKHKQIKTSSTNDSYIHDLQCGLVQKQKDLCSAVSTARNGILLPKLFWPTVRKNCSSDREKLLKFEAEGREFAKILRSLEQFIQTVKGQNNFC